MIICTKEKTPETKFIIGNLYRRADTEADVCIAIAGDNLVVLKSGCTFIPIPNYRYLDVTDQYCLQKVK